jgi:hypothetical protein
MIKHASMAFALSLVLLPRVAAAGKLPIFQGSAGALFTAGGQMWTEPDFPSYAEPYVSAVPFHDTSGGYGIGGGVFFEARFIKYIGLELDLLFEGNRMWYDIEYNIAGILAELRYNLGYTTIRMPILVKGVFETKVMRVSIGLGPEFVFTRGDDMDIEELTDHGADLGPLEAQYQTSPQNDTFLCVALGFAFKVWKLSIPLNIRYSHNMTQPDGWRQRLGDLDRDERDYVASHSMDLRLQLGVAYDF